MKKRIIWVVKMATFYSVVGIFLQGLAVSILLASTPTEAQNPRDVKLNINLSNVTLEKAFNKIEKNTNYRFLYNSREIPLNDIVNMNSENESVYKILELLAQNFNLSFNIVNEQIIVKKNDNDNIPLITTYETGSVKGYVNDGDTKEALVGVTVTLRGTTLGTMTDKRGYYEFSNLKPGKYTIAASYVGYSTIAKEILISSNKTTEANFQLGQSALNLDEVVVTGSISERSIRESANPITVISPKELENRDLSNISAVLQTVPGVFFGSANEIVAQGGRMLDQSMNNMRVRGAAAGGIGAKVKVIVDGVELADASMLTFIDPEQIVKIEIARGPMSTTLYGAGSAEGVIQIFTKRGMGKLSIDFKTIATSQESKYQDANPLNQQYSLSLSGSKGDIAYNLGINYSKFPISRWAKNNGIDEQDWAFTAGVIGKIDNITANLSVQKGTSTGGVGVVNQYQRIALEQGWPNPSAAAINPPYYDVHYKSRQIMTNLNLKQPITENLFHSLNISYSQQTSFSNYYTGTKLSDGTFSYKTNENDAVMTLAKYYANWSQGLSDFFKVNLTGGFDIQELILNSPIDYYTAPFDDDALLTGSKVASTSQGGTMTNNTQAVYFEGVWGFWNKLFLTTGIRAESNNSYGDNSGWYKIPRIGLTYVVEIGNFTIKPRISWGESTQPVSAMYKQDKISTVGTMQIYQVGNPDLKPQTQRGYEFGGDFFFLTNYSLNITYYHQKFVDMVTQQRLIDPAYFQKYQFINLQSVVNDGIEISGRAILSPFTVDIAYTYIHSVYGPGFPSESANISGNPEYHEGGRVLSVPKGSSFLRVAYTVPALLPWSSKGGNLAFEYVGRGDEYNLDYIYYYKTANESSTGKGTNVYKVFPSYFTLNLRGDYMVLNNTSIFVDIQNLLNNQDFSYSGPLRGRKIAFGLNVRL